MPRAESGPTALKMNQTEPAPGKWRRWVRTISPTCEDSARLLSAAQDRPLTGLERLGLRVHLRLCRWCRRYAQQLALLRQVLRSPDGESNLPAGEIAAADRSRIKQALREAGR